MCTRLYVVAWEKERELDKEVCISTNLYNIIYFILEEYDVASAHALRD
jgi:hypothetical protein